MTGLARFHAHAIHCWGESWAIALRAPRWLGGLRINVAAVGNDNAWDRSDRYRGMLAFHARARGAK